MKWLALLLLLTFQRVEAQGFDREWERIQQRYPVLQQLDNEDWKTWGWHAVIAVGVGHSIALLPYINRKTGMRLMVGYYFIRELDGVLRGNPKKFDAFMDVAVPLFTVELIW